MRCSAAAVAAAGQVDVDAGWRAAVASTLQHTEMCAVGVISGLKQSPDEFGQETGFPLGGDIRSADYAVWRCWYAMSRADPRWRPCSSVGSVLRMFAPSSRPVGAPGDLLPHRRTR